MCESLEPKLLQMNHTTLYRRWRPRSFGGIVGQEPVVRTLRRAIETDRVSHAYLFSGPRGTGKTSTAKVLAMGLNCEKGPTPEPVVFGLATTEKHKVLPTIISRCQSFDFRRPSIESLVGNLEEIADA